MRKLLIVDPSMLSLEGHSYNYDLAIAQAAARRFDEMVVYADREFHDTSARMPDCRPVLNRLRIGAGKRREIPADLFENARDGCGLRLAASGGNHQMRF